MQYNIDAIYAANLLYKCIPSIGSDLQDKLTQLQQLLNLCCFCLDTDRSAYKYLLLCQSLRGQYSVGWTHGESLILPGAHTEYPNCNLQIFQYTYKHWPLAANTLSSLHVWFAG